MRVLWVLASVLLLPLACQQESEIDRLMRMDKRPYLKHIPEMEKLAELANGGALGCGVGTVRVVTPSGVQAVRTGSADHCIFGQEMTLEELHSILIARAEGNERGTGPLANTGATLCFSTLSLLGSLGDPSSVPVIAPLLLDKSVTVRRWSLMALGGIGEKALSSRPAVGAAVKGILMPMEGNAPQWLLLAFRQPLVLAVGKEGDARVGEQRYSLDTLRDMLAGHVAKSHDNYVVVRRGPSVSDALVNQVNRIGYAVGLWPYAEEQYQKRLETSP